MCRSCSAASSRPPTTSRRPKRWPASRTSASFTRWRPSASSSAFDVKPYIWNPFFPVNTLNLMRAAVAAQFEGVFEKYVEAAFHHMWVEPKKMDDPEVAAEGARPPPASMRAKLFARAQDPDVKAKLIENTQAGGRARRVRLADLLRRQGNVLRQGAVARGRGNGLGEIAAPSLRAKRSNPILQHRPSMDCFVASLLAMTSDSGETQHAKTQRHRRRDRRRRLYRRRDRQEIRRRRLYRVRRPARRRQARAAGQGDRGRRRIDRRRARSTRGRKTRSRPSSTTPTSMRRWKSASSTSAPTSISRSWRPPTACSAKSGKWPAGPASWRAANRRG